MIVSEFYYLNEFAGQPIPTSDFIRFNTTAQRTILRMCKGRVTETNFATLPPSVQTAVQNAISAQINYYVLNGIDTSIDGAAPSDFTVGKVSVRGSGKSGGASMICHEAIAELEQTGLLNPQVGTIGSPLLTRWF